LRTMRTLRPLISRLPKKGTECFEDLSMNGIFKPLRSS
jgi:hypothetical protein